MLRKSLVAGVLATAVAVPVASADPPPQNAVQNYGQCVKQGFIDPPANVVSPLTLNKNNINFPPNAGGAVGCPKP